MARNTAKKIAETNVEVAVAVETPAVIYPTTEAMIAMGLTTKSSRIRHLHALGMKTGPIAKQECGGLYQHAFNVINKPLKTNKARDDASKALQAEAAKVEESTTESMPSVEGEQEVEA